jgi:hypothetical protein
VAPFVQTVPTREAAEKLELDFKLRRLGGDIEKVTPTTLGQEIDGFLLRLKSTGDCARGASSSTSRRRRCGSRCEP